MRGFVIVSQRKSFVCDVTASAQVSGRVVSTSV
jgi:hypothetical protein